jgi:hypothetical protein
MEKKGFKLDNPINLNKIGDDIFSITLPEIFLKNFD